MIINYEQKHQEDLEAAKGWLTIAKENNNTIAIQILENLFPELHESDDERIRKGLIKGLTAMRDIHNHQTFSDDAINIDDAIAWLEKQGEQNHTDEVEPKFNIGDWVTIKE